MIPYNRESDTTYPMLQVPNQVEAVGAETLITYEEFVTNLIKELGDLKQNLNHMVMGVAGEAGELVDGVKKYTIYGKDLDLSNIIEELGDLEFFMAGIRQLLGIPRNDVIRGNYAKLLSRYQGMQYTDEAAIAREDKQPGLVTIDMSKEVLTGEEIELINATKKITDDQVAAVDDTAGLNLANHEQAK